MKLADSTLKSSQKLSNQGSSAKKSSVKKREVSQNEGFSPSCDQNELNNPNFAKPPTSFSLKGRSFGKKVGLSGYTSSKLRNTTFNSSTTLPKFTESGNIMKILNSSMRKNSLKQENVQLNHNEGPNCFIQKRNTLSTDAPKFSFVKETKQSKLLLVNIE